MERRDKVNYYLDLAKMIGSALYLVGVEADTENEYREIPVQQWIEDDESLNGTLGY